ncbi:bifunctional adenosylcobinamide kinase/adenosylcobinamide-phosphate guanylyltransferase [Alcanivorax sp. JB21]|uniref:bifunctional adenosylcobinamide kinase/adenosylcobinamide-phosphate guanylyltransferase n=1 Tax=Alcanivorax limicola TaxID=2874102 RepID=UPI001CBCDBAE|nr:bifunctional adenosylcobinamide kinase/adenosylcobinamide-phosphate guanylyltransferase [Alcanivorax limicola]MBZ2190383.1 bifunctional adenosylcobinamide kinase/adenosylcobinamide-phosphate guanylyltransferase [Alcanivorax limicola]
MQKTLILGGIRSGKSARAEALVRPHPKVAYVATATAGDEEMAARIDRHRARRPARWQLIEAPLSLGMVLREAAMMPEPPCLLVDCMSLWVSNLLHAGEAIFGRERDAFLQALTVYPAPVVIVSNETGLGTIGMDPLTRRFCDELGWLNQALAARCQSVELVMAGLSLPLKRPV